MELKQITKYKDKYCTDFVISQILALKKYFNINSSNRIFYLERWNDRSYFLCKNRIFVIGFEFKGEYPYQIEIESAYVITLDKKEIANFETIKADDTTPKFRMFKGQKIDETKSIYTENDFSTWYNSLCSITNFVNVPHYQLIEFLQKYNQNTFKTKRYSYYVKRDNDRTMAFYVYAKDLITNAEFKIYHNFSLKTKIPCYTRDLAIKVLKGSLSEFQIRQAKKSFIEFCKQESLELKTTNYYALELVKQTIQPIEIDNGWFIAKPFAGEFEFNNIWIDDELGYDKKPYFVISDSSNPSKIQKIAVLDFLKPQYKSTDYYINGYMKRNHWELDRETLNKLTLFLQKPFDKTLLKIYTDLGHDICVDGIKTNWQWLISEYNENTGWKYEKLSLDLPMPDYNKLN